MNFKFSFFKSLLTEWGLSEMSICFRYMVFAINLLFILFSVYIAFQIVKYLVTKTLKLLLQKIRIDFITYLGDKLSTNLLSLLIILPLVINFAIEPLFIDFPLLTQVANRTLNTYLVVIIVLVLVGIVNGVKLFYINNPKYKDNPIEGFSQVAKIILWVVGILLSISILVNQSPLKLFGLLGGASVILIVAFKDTILGFVASIQLLSNDMVHIGDWITLEQYNADGDVTEINLTAVKVQNFDNTITTIPTYALISGSFKNWQGMIDSGGRRIKRSILINKSSIKFCTDVLLDKFEDIILIKDYIIAKRKELYDANQKYDIAEVASELKINGLHMTNLGCYRVYIEAYLASRPEVNTEMLYMARYLDATDKGLPVEVYAFSKLKEWMKYEKVMADIFDHLYAATSYFDLNIVQSVNSQDIIHTSFSKSKQTL